MLSFQFTVTKSQLPILQKACKLMSLSCVTVSTTTTTAKVTIKHLTAGKDITPVMIFKLGRLAENEYVFKSEIDFAAEWRALFTAKQTKIVGQTTPF